MTRHALITLTLLALAGWPLLPSARAAETTSCHPTPEDELGPLYQPDAPVRNVVGSGYRLFGSIQSVVGCTPISNARIEIWMAGPDGHYGENWRATLFSDANGRYHFQSHTPPDYGTGRPHIHIKVSAAGYTPLVTQHYPRPGAGEALFDLVIRPR